jgi:undecaprenyl-diphosphatase
MQPSFLQIVFLAVVQGLAELLPVSSSAHVIIAEKLMGLDPSAPSMTFLLVMLHTGTMFAVILFFWPKWRALWQAGLKTSLDYLRYIALATGFTGVIGLGLKFVIEKIVLSAQPDAEIEHLFKNLPLIACSLTAAAVIIIIAGFAIKRPSMMNAEPRPLSNRSAAIIGIVQGLCLPFRGFSRSGATISAGLLQRLARDQAETFSFALAVVLTPPVLLLQILRLLKANAAAGVAEVDVSLFTPGIMGMFFSFLAGLAALRWLSSWLEHGRWHFFGFYCLAASMGVWSVHWLMPS